MLRKAVFIGANRVVVNVLRGDIDEETRDSLIAQYRIIYGAEQCVMVDDSVPVWIGGSYDSTSGVFSPPPSPEPEPEPIVEEPINDDAPII
jgi:hypothetical protein